MPESETRKPEEILKDILSALQSNTPESRLNGISQLHEINYSSEAIRGELEKLALHDPNEDVRNEALAALNLATQRNVRSRASKIDRASRNLLLQEIKEWEKLGILEEDSANILRRRYDFDIAPAAAPKPAAKVKATEPARETQPEAQSTPAPALIPEPSPIRAEIKSENKPTPAPVSIPEPSPMLAEIKSESKAAPAPVQQRPQPTLTETLLSETSIKIALYLGAFFVISSATIFAALYEIARLPILVISTIIFGGFAVAIHKRLPQPSFAIFIIFSFLLPITANVLKESLNLSPPFGAAYWVFICAFMALIWAGGTWLYESRMFSLTAFAALIIALYRVGDVFDASTEFYPTMLGFAALAGLIGVWALKKWKGANFAFPLLVAAQLLQLVALGASAAIYFAQFVMTEPSSPLWNFAHIFTWGFAFVFYAFSDVVIPFVLFPWFAAATLIGIPWFIGAAFETAALGGTILFFICGFVIAAASEAAHWLEKARKYSLPVLLVSIITVIPAMINGFIKNETTGFICALGVTLIYAALQFIRPRGLLWAFALLNFIIAYFAFFNLPFIHRANIFFGYELLGLSLIFLTPDLFLKNDLGKNWTWRLAPRMYGRLFTAWSFLVYPVAGETPLINTAIMFGVYAVFFTICALRYNSTILGYIAMTALALSTIYFINHFEWDIVLESLSVLSALYFFSGFALKKNESSAAWRTMLEASGLILGGIVSLVALYMQKEYTGWFVALIGVMFIVQMYSRKQNMFEAGAQIILNIACYLILKDLRVSEASHILMALSLVILSMDMLFTLTFKEPRPLELPVKMIGGVITLTASLIFITENNELRSAIGFMIYTGFFFIYAAAQRKAVYGYIPAAYLPLTIFFILKRFNMNETAWLPTLTGLAVLYFAIGIAIRSKEDWSFTLRNSALALGAIISMGALSMLKETGGWYIAVIGLLFIAEMYIRKQGLFEISAQILFPAALYLILRDFKLDDSDYILLGCSLIWLGLDLIFSHTFKEKRPLEGIVKVTGMIAALLASMAFLVMEDSARAAIGFGLYTIFFAVYTVVQRKAVYGYLPAGYLALMIFFTLRHFDLDAWLPALTSLAVIYFAVGISVRAKEEWSHMLRYSALILGTIISLGAIITLKETGGWYALVVGLLFAVEMVLSRNGLFEVGIPAMFTIGAFLILRDFNINENGYHLLAFSLVWLLTDMLAHSRFTNPRPLKWIVRGVGAALTLVNYAVLFTNSDSKIAAVGFGVYALLLLAISLLYNQPNLLYTFTLTLPLFATFLFRAFDLTKWIHPVIFIAVIYYTAGYFLRMTKLAAGWETPLLFSGLGIGVIVSFSAPILGGVDAALPIALAATLWAAEAFARRNVWLGFPANGLYLLAYFVILFELNVDQPQFFSVGAALLGMIQHYLLTRAESKSGAFIMGMVSQLVLLGTTYIQMTSTEQLGYFFVLFFQSLAVIVYGGVFIRSRSLTFTPIGIVTLGLFTVLYSALKGISAVILVGCSGVLLLMLGILAVVMRERITNISEKLSDWKA